MKAAGQPARTIAFFCVIDGRRYLPMAITALRSIRRFHSEAGYYVVGRFADDAVALETISQHGLEFVHLDLSDVFSDCLSFRSHALARRHPPAPWPSECFWWTFGPALLSEMGYTHSCAVDGDVLGVGPLDLDDVFDGRAPMGAVEKPNGRLNSGVLFFDHARLAEFELVDQARRLYDTLKTCDHERCTGLCRARSDQGLLLELQRRCGLDVRRIGNAYNHMLIWDEQDYLERNTDAPFGVDDSRILHLLSKPWDPPPRRGLINPIMRDGYQLWWDFARELWPDDEQRRQHFGRERTIELGRSLSRMLRP